MRLPTPEFKVLLYAPDVPASGIKARVHFEDAVLVVQGKGHWFTIQAENLSLETGGFDGRQWLLAWETPSGPARVILQNENAVIALIKLAPTVVADRFKQVHLAHENKGLLLRLLAPVLALLLLAPALFFGLFWIFSDEVSHWAAARVSLQQKVRLGEDAFEKIRPTLDLVEQAEVRELVEFIGVRVTTGSRNRYIFHVVVAPEINAFAMPGGHIFVNTGLLRELQNSGELAAVLAHLASHVEAGHILSKLIRSLGWRAVLAAAGGDFSSNIWAEMSMHLSKIDFSPEMELEADTEALNILRRAGVSADGMLPFFKRMMEHDISTPGFWVSHPSSQTRLDALSELIAAKPVYQSHPLSVDWDEFQRSLAYLYAR